MTAATLQQQTAAASAYEALLVPALFERWADKVADTAKVCFGPCDGLGMRHRNPRPQGTVVQWLLSLAMTGRSPG